MQRKVSFAIGEYYHVYARGVERRKIFLERVDHLRFLALLYVANSPDVIHISDHEGKTLSELLNLARPQTLVSIGAYCLMPNHFHLLLREKREGGVSAFMKKLLTGYSMYFNIRNQRTGTLFDRPFKSEHAGSDRYLKYLFAYVHLNPIKLLQSDWRESGLDNFPQARIFLNNYRYSSFADYNGVTRAEGAILDREALPAYFADQSDFLVDLNDWLTYGKESP